MRAIGAVLASQAQVRLGIAFTLAGIICTAGVGYAAYPAGTTNAVLSFIDAAGGHVSVNRHWPWNPEDVQMYPFTPYLWNSCLPGDGAIILLVTGPGYQPAVGASAEAYTRQYLSSLGRTIAASLSGVPQARGGSDLRTIIAGMTTPGNPAYESLKEGILWVNSLDYYESYGYAIFLVIRWKWVFPSPGCYTDMVAVPEGYGIPYVALGRPGKDSLKLRAIVDGRPVAPTPSVHARCHQCAPPLTKLQRRGRRSLDVEGRRRDRDSAVPSSVASKNESPRSRSSGSSTGQSSGWKSLMMGIPSPKTDVNGRFKFSEHTNVIHDALSHKALRSVRRASSSPGWR